jgi:hypothetical protein
VAIIPLTKGREAIIDAKDAGKIKGNWSYGGNGYAMQLVPGTRKFISLHHIITGLPADTDIDHHNRDPLDCRESNLRPCTQSQNNCNGKMRSDNKSGYRGVSWDKTHRKWCSEICFEGKRRRLGRFDNDKKKEAAQAYDKAARELHGEFAHLNFP